MFNFLKKILKKDKIIVRFAPSPTGELHIGGARTAFFNFLFAKHNKGKFLLRIEDTDRERLIEDSIGHIIESLEWLGLNIDSKEYIILQSKRLDIYKKHAFDLVKKGHAYICVCSKEKLAIDQQDQIKSEKAPMYLGHCRGLDIKIKDVEGIKPYVIRMKMPKTGKTIVRDSIKGDVEFDLSLIDDQIILKSDGFPTYHLASMVDDHESDITYVIRGEEWLPSTPKHLLLYQMFDWQAPQFCHLPMILAPDKTKLSKRHGATGVFEYRKLGYLPEALLNFIGLLGWHPKNDREVLSLDEMINEFSLNRVQKGSAIFDVKKLNWLNSYYIKKADNARLKSILEEIFGSDFIQGKMIDKLIILSKERLEKLSDFKEINDFFFKLPDYESNLLIWKKSSPEKALENLGFLIEKLSKVDKFDKTEIESLIMPFADEKGRGDVLWPLRVALSGRGKSPGPFDIMDILGKKETIQRISTAILKLR
ncbi:glutamate--tRNA ligase [Patescibacteria group bacterium]|nr:glutamate--tRNA ligase [Patescibacteria group bacterium]